jgi:hypothetical protein
MEVENNCSRLQLCSIFLVYTSIWSYSIFAIVKSCNKDSQHMRLPFYVTMSLIYETLHGIILIGMIPYLKRIGSRYTTIYTITSTMCNGTLAIWGGNQIFIMSKKEDPLEDIYNCALILFSIQNFIGAIYVMLSIASVTTGIRIYFMNKRQNIYDII